MNSLCIIDEGADNIHLEMSGGFINNEVFLMVSGFLSAVEISLTRAQVAQLRDHLNKLLESSIAQVK